MSRKNKNKEKKEHYRFGGRNTETHESGVVLIWTSLLEKRRLSKYQMIDQIIEGRDEKGDYVETISKKNMHGARIHVIERKYLQPGKRHTPDETPLEKWYAKWDSFAKREYEILLEKNGMQKGNSVITSDVSKKAIISLEELLDLYTAGIPGQ